jgi:hypothetical protein
MTHGHTKNGLVSREYKSWDTMKSRCNNPKDPSYTRYGARGITICERWVHSFENFYEDMGERPLEMSLDRKDNDGDYCKENCRWATRREQQNNRRDTKWIEYHGEIKTINQWAKDLNIGVETLRRRIKNSNWTKEEALTLPLHTRDITNIMGKQ